MTARGHLASAVAQRAGYRRPVYGQARVTVPGTRGCPARYTNGARAGLRPVPGVTGPAWQHARNLAARVRGCGTRVTSPRERRLL
jgi:hypothetical protein